MKLSTPLLVAALACLAGPVCAQTPTDPRTAVGPYYAVTNRTVYQKPPLPTLGPAGTSILDPVFGSTITRITDAATRPDSPNRSFKTPSATHQNSWSVSTHYFYVISNGGTIIPFTFDSTTATARRIKPTTTGAGGLVLTFYIEPQFSYVSDGVIFGSYSGVGATRRTVDQYDFSTGTYTRLLNLDDLIPGLSGTYVGGITSSGGATERIAAWFGGASQDHHHYIAVFDRANAQNRLVLDTFTSTVNGSPLPFTLNFSLHHVAMDRSGRYVMLYPTSADFAAPRYASQEYLWDTQTNTITDMNAATHPYGHDAYGYGAAVNKDCCTTSSYDAAQWQMRSLANATMPRDLIKTILTPKETYMSDHPTWNNARPDQLMPFLTAPYRYGTVVSAWRAWDDEVIAIQTDAAPGTDPTVWRFAHHRSNVAYDGDPTKAAFWYMPRANVSQDGHWVLFTSNWEKTLGSDPAGDPGTGARQDVFLVSLAAGTDVTSLRSMVTIPPATLPGGRVGDVYSAVLNAAGGSGSYKWSLAAGVLPAGLLVSAAGVISGTPLVNSSYAFTVRAVDAVDSTNAATATYAIVIGASRVTLRTTSVPGGGVGAGYSTTLQATGGSGVYAWSISSGSLPSGLALGAQNGQLAGYPQAPGTFGFTVNVADAGDSTNSASRVYSIAIAPKPVSITTSAVPAGQVGTAYSVHFDATGGYGSYAWSTGTALPAGLTLDASGVLSGTPQPFGTVTVGVTATDTADSTDAATASFTLAISPAPVAITTSALASGRVGTVYSASLHATGGQGQYAWSLTSGALPAGLTLGADGAIYGTPQSFGTFTVQVRAADSADGTNAASATLTLSIATAPVTLTTSALPAGRIGSSYSIALQASGGNGAYTWSMASGSLPAGLTLTPAGALSGTPQVYGTFTIGVTVVDSVDATNSATASLPLTIATAPVTVTATGLPSGRVGTSYSAALQATGGHGSYAWSVTSGALPGGLTLSPSGTISGTPQAFGSFTIAVSAVDTADATNGASASFSLVISSAQVIITTTSVPSGRVATPYSASLTAAGGQGTYNWSLTSGSLPAGVALASNGVLSGTPQAFGTFTIGVMAADAVDATNKATAAFVFSVATAPVTVTSSFAGNGRVNVAYSSAAQAAGGAGTYVWSVTGGALPAGLTLNAATGTIAGTPTAAATFTASIMVSDATDASNCASMSSTFVIGTPQVAVTPTTLPSGRQKVAYSATQKATGGSGQFTWSISAGALPAGIVMSATTGTLSGSPTTAGTFTFTVSAADATDATNVASATYMVTIAPSIKIISPRTLPTATVGVPYTYAVTYMYAQGTVSFSLAGGTLPPGMSLDAVTGVISGTCTTAGTYSFNARVKDVNTSDTLTLTVQVK